MDGMETPEHIQKLRHAQGWYAVTCTCDFRIRFSDADPYAEQRAWTAMAEHTIGKHVGTATSRKSVASVPIEARRTSVEYTSVPYRSTSEFETVTTANGLPIACTCSKFANNIRLFTVYTCEHMRTEYDKRGWK